MWTNIWIYWHSDSKHKAFYCTTNSDIEILLSIRMTNSVNTQQNHVSDIIYVLYLLRAIPWFLFLTHGFCLFIHRYAVCIWWICGWRLEGSGQLRSKLMLWNEELAYMQQNTIYDTVYPIRSLHALNAVGIVKCGYISTAVTQIILWPHKDIPYIGDKLFVKYETKWKHFHSWKCICKCCLSNGGHFIQAGMH